MEKKINEVSVAFESVDYRSLISGQKNVLDRVSVRDYICDVEIGAFQTERNCTQRVKFNIILEVSSSNAFKTDDVDDVLSYELITETINKILAVERINLLETLAELIAKKCLAESRALKIFIRIEKLDRIPGTLGIEIVRSKPVNLLEDTPKSYLNQSDLLEVVYLSNDVLAGEFLETWISILTSSKRAVIICLDPVNNSVLRSRTIETRKRIKLLCIDQNAWFLKSLDERLDVVSNRTELDWARKNKKVVIWSPTKIIMDSLDSIEVNDDSLNIATWLAMNFKAMRLVCVRGASTELSTNSVLKCQNLLHIVENEPEKF